MWPCPLSNYVTTGFSSFLFVVVYRCIVYVCACSLTCSEHTYMYSQTHGGLKLTLGIFLRCSPLSFLRPGLSLTGSLQLQPLWRASLPWDPLCLSPYNRDSRQQHLPGYYVGGEDANSGLCCSPAPWKWISKTTDEMQKVTDCLFSFSPTAGHTPHALTYAKQALYHQVIPQSKRTVLIKGSSKTSGTTIV